MIDKANEIFANLVKFFTLSGTQGVIFVHPFTHSSSSDLSRALIFHLSECDVQSYLQALSYYLSLSNKAFLCSLKALSAYFVGQI